MAVWRFLTAVVLALTLFAPAVALSEENDSGSGNNSGAILLGYNRVEDANCYSLELDFKFGSALWGLGLFMIDNGNMPSIYFDYPPPNAALIINRSVFNANETGGYVKYGRVYSQFRVFGMFGGTSVTRKYVVQTSPFNYNYVVEEKFNYGHWVYGGGIGYLLFDKVLVQYQYDNRRKDLIMVGISF